MAHHHEQNGRIYVDTAFLNGTNRIPGVTLKHMGFGEFYAETPKGRVDFDRMRGKDFPGQSGRSHEFRGKGADWLLDQMERAGISVRVASKDSDMNTDRSAIIRLASALPKGSSERKTLLAMAKSAAFSGPIGSGKNGYIAFYKNDRVEVMADTQYEAQQLAAKHFRARRPYDVTVHLAEKGGKQVTHMPMFASKKTASRPLHVIAREIAADWGPKVHYAAKPYLRAMMSMDSIDDSYGYDDGHMIVRYFLTNARSWRGPVAKQIKDELKRML